MLTKQKLFSVLVVFALTAQLLIPVAVSAATLTSASLELSDQRPSQTSDYTFTASNNSTGTTIRCVELVLNDQADGLGSIPTGITTTSSTLDSSTLITAGSWTVDNGSNGTLSITNGTGETPAGTGDIVWGGVANSSVTGTTFYGIYTSYTDASCTGGNEVDTVTIAYVHLAGQDFELVIGPTLTCTIVGVTSSQTVNNATTTIGSTATGVDFGSSITAVANGVSAHDIQIDTNAPVGYVVYIRHTQLFTNGASDTIDNHTGTNVTPTAFPGAGTEAWGYTTEDSNLTGGTVDRFTSAGGNKWSGFSTSNEPIIDSTTATAGTETTRVGHQVGFSTTSEAGTYNTTVIYTVVATF